MPCDRSSSTCTHWNLRRGARCWKLLRRHTSAAGFITALGLTCCSTTALDRRSHAVGRNAIWLSHHRQIVPLYSSLFCLRLYNFNLVWQAVHTKDSGRRSDWVHQKWCFMLNRCLMGHTWWWTLGFDVLTLNVP